MKETIVIYRKNENEVVALDKAKGKTAKAVCCPNDIFDFKTGAKLAFERLIDSEDVREVHRIAKVGEYVKIVDACVIPAFDDEAPAYKNGDILRIIDIDGFLKKPRFREGSDHFGFEYVLNPNEYVVLEGYEPVSPSIKVGDRVTVIDDGKQYTTYNRFFKQNNIDFDIATRYAYGRCINNGGRYRVVAIGEHVNGHFVYVIEAPISGACYLIGADGVEKC